MTTYLRQSGSQAIWIKPMTEDPPAETNRVLVYAREVDGVMRTLARFSNGLIKIIL